jgi:hypothetical protein
MPTDDPVVGDAVGRRIVGACVGATNVTAAVIVWNAPRGEGMGATVGTLTEVAGGLVGPGVSVLKAMKIGVPEEPEAIDGNAEGLLFI